MQRIISLILHAGHSAKMVNIENHDKFYTVIYLGLRTSSEVEPCDKS
jgi:hypothetical protein